MSKTILSDVATVIDSLHDTPTYTESIDSYPMVRVVDVNNAFLDLRGCFKVDFNNFEKHNKKYVPQRGDIVITRVGSYGMVALVDTDEKFCLGQNIAIIHPDKIDGKFLYYYILSPYLQKHIYGNIGGSSYKCISLKDINNFPINSGTIDTKKVGNILYSIDKKIQNNKKQIEILESIAKTIYDYWFVQFDFPNEEGKPYKSSGGKMVWNNEIKAEIPEGWTVSDLRNKIRVIRGVSYSPKDELKEKTDNSVYLLKSNNIENGTINYEKPIILDNTLIDNEQFLTKGSIFITMSSGSKVHMGKTAIVYFDMNYAFGAFCSKIEIKPNYKNYLSLFFRSEFFRKYIEKVTSGTSINNIGNDHLTNIKIPFPSMKVQEKFEKLTDIYFDSISQKIKESDNLNSLKDFLLPLLMNGQISV